MLKKIDATARQKVPKGNTYKFDLADVKGQLRPRCALEISATGGHSLLLKGPLGIGKTLLASCSPNILPTLNPQENLEVASIYSIAKTKQYFGQYPFHVTHHTICDRARRLRLPFPEIN